MTAINRVIDDGYRLSHLRRSTLVLHTLRLKFHRFDLSPCLLLTCLQHIDNKSIKWSLSTIVQICCKTIFLGVPSDLLSTDARCLIIILGGQCNRPDAMLSAVHDVVVCLSVRLFVCIYVCVCVSVTFQYCMKTVKRRITQIMPHDRPRTLVFKWDVLYSSCRIFTDKRVARSHCHSRASCYLCIFIVLSGVSIGRARRAVHAGPALWGAQNLSLIHISEPTRPY